MSMLAERKVKQKWSLNPRGNAWSEDSSKFGQKMLEKMGWSHGKGLGAKEDGMVDHVKVSYKNDSKGMGYKETNDQWTEHDSNFNALLKALSGEKNGESVTKIASLEKKSQSSKVRVHYKKFTRGKDLSRCSEKDLANIFGKKSLKEAPKQVEEEAEDKSSDSFLHNGGSMVDYFKKKFPGYGKNSDYVVGSNGVLKKNSDSEDEAYSGFGFKSPITKEKDDSLTGNGGSMVDYFKKKFPNFGKSNASAVGSNGVSKNSDSEDGAYSGFGFKSPIKRKSDGEIANKTPKKFKSDAGLSNPAFEPLFSKIEIEKHVLNTIKEQDEEESEKKIKKKKRNDNLNDSSNIEVKNTQKSNGDISPSTVGHTETKRIRNNSNCDSSCDSKLNNQKKEEDNLAIDNPNFDEENSKEDYIDGNFEVKRKKKKMKMAIDNPNFSKENARESYIDEKFEVKRKKKKTEIAIDNPNFSEENARETYIDDKFEVKRKKKKTKMAIDNPNFDDTNDSQTSYVNENFEVKRKKKKKDKKSEENSLAIDNPNFNDKNDSQSSFVNENFEVKRKKKKNKDSLALDNPNFDDKNECQNSYTDENYEIKRKKKKQKKSQDIKATDNPNFNVSLEDPVTSVSEDRSTKNKEAEIAANSDEPVFDLMLNVTSTPALPKQNATPKQSSNKRRKSVRFSNVTEEHIIPSNEEIANRNELFDINSKVIANGLSGQNVVDEFSKKIDGFQAEIENDINEKKSQVRYIGEVGNPDGENEKLPEGVRLKFKYAKFGRSPIWANKNVDSKSKSSYRHLIKGDIVVNFKNSNLDEIKGYGIETQGQ